MKGDVKNLSFRSADELLFSTQQERDDAVKEHIENIPLSDLHAFKNHPFKVKEDDSMIETAESIKEYGVLVPAIARPDPNGGYEIISGHRRHYASKLAGIETMPVIVRNLDDDAATIIMVDSNLQRENILPSERAFAYKMKLDAMKRQSGRPPKENGGQIGHHLSKVKTRDILAEQTGDSPRNVQRIIRLTELIPPLLEMVDEKKIALSPAYELTYLKKEEQEMLLDAMEYEQATPSLSQALHLKKYSQEGHLSDSLMTTVLAQEKKGSWNRVTLSSDTLKQYFPENYTADKMQATIIALLKQWKRTQDKNLSR